MSKHVSISMRGSRWLVSLDAETLAALYALVILDDEIRRMPIYRSCFRASSPASIALKEAVRAEVERVKTNPHP